MAGQAASWQPRRRSGQSAARHQRIAAEASRRLAEPPTGRVLRLLAAGKFNQRTARDLVASLDTGKTRDPHPGKLGAANRTEAATRPGSWA